MKLEVSGQEVLIDDEDYPILSRYRWFVKQPRKISDLKYICAHVYHNKKVIKISMHRLIMGMDSLEIDHINRNPFDNRKCNLRYCTSLEQQRNRKRNNKTGFMGVKEARGKFSARLSVGPKRFFSGGFKTAEEAAREYDRLANLYFGKFAALNFPKETL